MTINSTEEIYDTHKFYVESDEAIIYFHLTQVIN